MTNQPSDTATPFLPELEIDGPVSQRRWTVLLRIILLIPHFLVLYFLGIAAAVVLIVAWVAALALGRVPAWISDFLALFVGYEARVNAYLLLLVDTYPAFVTTVPDYPVRVDIRPGELNRWKVLFRIILVIPAAVLAVILGYGVAVLGFFLWLAVLIAGRTTTPIFGANAAFLRFSFRVRAYFFLLTDAYPKRLFGDAVAESPEEGAASVGGTRPLRLSSGARTLVIVFIVVGVLAIVGNGIGQYYSNEQVKYPHEYEQYDGY